VPTYYGGVNESSGNTGASQGNDDPGAGAALDDRTSEIALANNSVRSSFDFAAMAQDVGGQSQALGSTASQAALSSDTAQLDQAPTQMLQGSVQQTQLFGEVSNDFANQPPGNPSGGGCSMPPPLQAMTPKLDNTPPGQTPQIPPPPNPLNTPDIPLTPETASSQTPPSKPLIGSVRQDKLIIEISKTQTPPPGTPRRPLIGKVQKNRPTNGGNKPVDLKSDKAKRDEGKEKEKDEEDKPTLRGKAGMEPAETETERENEPGEKDPKKTVSQKKPSFAWGIGANVPIKKGQLYKDPDGRGEVLPWEVNAGVTQTKDSKDVSLTAGIALSKWNAGNEKGFHGSLSVGTAEGGIKGSISNNPLDRHVNLEAGAEANLLKVSAESPTFKSPTIFGKVLTIKFGADGGLGVRAKFKMNLAQGVKDGFKFRTSSHAGFGPAFGGQFDIGWQPPSPKGGKK
jgi:hypothetical protein